MAADPVQVAFGPLEAFTERRVKGIILGIAANITEDMPVDTGHAANNTVPSIGTPYGEVDGSNESPSRAAQQAGVVSVATGYKLPQIGYISNNVPYVPKLNDGWSQQAPAGFIQAGILRAIRTEAAKEQ